MQYATGIISAFADQTADLSLQHILKIKLNFSSLKLWNGKAFNRESYKNENDWMGLGSRKICR